jgi:hypothetical protein
MDKRDLHSLGERMISLLEKYGIQYDTFKMTVNVTPDYFRSIKEGFRDEATGEILPLVQGPNWYVDLYYLEGLRADDNSETKDTDS